MWMIYLSQTAMVSAFQISRVNLCMNLRWWALVSWLIFFALSFTSQNWNCLCIKGDMLLRYWKRKMELCNAVISPAEPRLQLSKNKDDKDVDSTQYRRLIWYLRYLCNTRPNLAFSVGIVSRFMKRLKVSHMEANKRILRYVKGSIGCIILFPAADTGKKCNFLDFIDSNWFGDKDDQKSTTGYIFMFGTTPIS